MARPSVLLHMCLSLTVGGTAIYAQQKLEDLYVRTREASNLPSTTKFRPYPYQIWLRKPISSRAY